MRRGFLTAIAAFVVVAFAGASAPAKGEPPLPTFDGTMSFPAIKSHADPEEFSWEVTLYDDQELQQVDDHQARVIYVDTGDTAFTIAAGLAHDAEGSKVPTTLAVSNGNVLTLTVHHRAGNPLADGAPFDYPVQSGAAWIAIDKGWIVPPLLEVSLDKVFEQIMQENPESVMDRQSGSPQCLVPKLVGRSLAASRKRLRRSDCRIGRVNKRKGAVGMPNRVIHQSPKAGTVLAGSAKINLTLAGELPGR